MVVTKDKVFTEGSDNLSLTCTTTQGFRHLTSAEFLRTHSVDCLHQAILLLDMLLEVRREKLKQISKVRELDIGLHIGTR